MLKCLRKSIGLLLVVAMVASMLIGLSATSSQAALTDGVVLDYAGNTTFNGTSTYIDKTADISKVSGLTTGTIAVKFKSTSTAVAKTFISASHSADASSNITLALNNGTIHFENRENGTYATNLNSSVTNFNNGAWHTAVVTVDSTGTKIYVDGALNCSNTSNKFFSYVTSLNSMNVGRNVHDAGGEWYYAGDIEFVKVYNRALTSAEITELSGGAFFTEQMLFDISDGKGYAEYRIPSVAVTGNGTVLAVVEARSGGDQTPTDLVLRRSTDGGATFGAQVILSPGKTQGNAEMNPMLLAENTGSRVHLLWGRWVWGNCKYFIRTSTDNGATWGAARDITYVLDAYKTGGKYTFPNLSAAGMGPGHGIQHSNGMLIVPIYITTANWTNSSVATIFSTDNGTTWQAGTWVPNPTGFTKIHENMMVVLSNGQILANMRNPGSDYRAISKTNSVTGTWSTPYSDTTLIDPVCAASIHKYDATTIAFTNCANTSTRTNLSIRLSNDNCTTWYKTKTIYSGTAGYSDVFVAPNKDIFCLYEKPQGSKISLARFNKTWVEN